MINIPFNHQPLTVEIKTGTYTIPVGKYARITVSLSANAYGKLIESGAGQLDQVRTMNTTSDSMSKTAVFFVPTGTALNVSTLAANTTTSGSSTTSLISAEDSSYSTFTIGGTIALEVRAFGTAQYTNAASSGSDFISVSSVGDSDARYIVELFKEIS
ncbi:MAG: hypothetical protein KAJ40_08845 [Alphaproteobacteria bacterium]|nr:hypothetical protein [Alphaproteobacteria bacterium]